MCRYSFSSCGVLTQLSLQQAPGVGGGRSLQVGLAELLQKMIDGEKAKQQAAAKKASRPPSEDLA
jgi:hypothetical protein